MPGSAKKKKKKEKTFVNVTMHPQYKNMIIKKTIKKIKFKNMIKKKPIMWYTKHHGVNGTLLKDNR
jgi:hypothetical protein